MIFFRVLYVELFKLFRQKRLLVFMLIPILTATLTCFFYTPSTGRQTLGPELSVQMLNNVMPFLGFFFVIMVASFLVAEDYDSGTLKLSIMRPVSRFTIFNAKVVTLYTAIFTFYLLFFVVTFFLPTILFGTNETVVFTQNFQVSEFVGFTMNKLDAIWFIFRCYLLSSSGAFVLGTILLFFSTATSKPSVAITLSVVLFVACYMWMAIFSNTPMIRFSPWTFMYLFVPYFSEYMGRGVAWRIPLIEMLGLMLLYFTIPYILSNIIFLRKNILK